MIVVNVRAEQIQLEHESNFYYYMMFKLQVNVSRCQHDNDQMQANCFAREEYYVGKIPPVSVHFAVVCSVVVPVHLLLNKILNQKELAI